MKHGAFLSLALTAVMGAIAIPMLPSFAQAQSRTRIGDLQQRARGTVISGEVVSVVGNDFTLRDGSGEIIVDAGPRWWREINLKPGEEVSVRGEIGKKSGEFDAFSITRANGSTIEIRPAEGPPPWAGKPKPERLPAAAQPVKP
ncbi:NirD/YgiW/YdeI family stress tolerance protein [Chroococcidiopsis thermalis]|uniref:Nucleic acid binding OB-fold tRNA/helicase-type n=1 Tax=Chroococcidiopsis thermalis (strain PCC 7203) TaxID=251229 RepID=K9U5L4_CHRTP|nr:NirD/YgiW/YdeI family stress tolerance protein [Chroococcidiopsis thermalis]AFY89908.1 nucleic acid binding OB-fold tRNA/helicase-type [Chroococcidiopsis thermalis PCC 7203]